MDPTASCIWFKISSTLVLTHASSDYKTNRPSINQECHSLIENPYLLKYNLRANISGSYAGTKMTCKPQEPVHAAL